MTRPQIKKLSLIIFFCTLYNNLFCQNNSLLDTYVHLDLPYGYECTEQYEDSCVYVNNFFDCPITTEVKVIPSNQEDCINTLQNIMTKLKASVNVEPFNWENKECCVFQLAFNLDKSYEGWGILYPSDDEQYFIFILSYTKKEYMTEYFDIIFTSLNSVWTNNSNYFKPGILMSCVYNGQNTVEISFNFDGKDIKSNINVNDYTNAQTLIEIEYNVFRMTYNQSNINEIRRRMYRMIYRDNSGRIQNIIKDVVNEYQNKCTVLEFCQKVLTWTQNLPYTRAETITLSDITNFSAVFMGEGNDCDSRSMIICAFMQYIGLDSALFISNDFRHALCGIALDAPGQKFTVENTQYLLGETTAKVTWGTIAKEHANPKKWDCVYLY